MKRMIQILMAVFLLMGLVGGAAADRQWLTCDVTRTGPHSNGDLYIELACPAAATRYWYTIHPNIGNEGLATALSAISLNKSVYAYVDPFVKFSYVEALYLIAQ